MYHLLWIHCRKGKVWEGYVTPEEVKKISAKDYVQIIYKREISVSKHNY